MNNLTFRGSCLCGSVQYEVSGEPKRFYHCHCSRCRKATGTGHASNIMIQAESFRWIKGEGLLHRFKVPDAERFYTQFCSQCGSGMPRNVPEIGMVIIPAGSLDHEIPIKPQARIFWDSRAEWSCGGDGIAVYPEYP